MDELLLEGTVHNYERVKQLQLLLYSKSTGYTWIDESIF